MGLELVANARMYAVTEAARAAWTSIFVWLSQRTGVSLRLLDHPPPRPLSELWRRDDLGCVMMCGWPFARMQPRPRLLAAPVPLPQRYGDAPIYFSDILVHRDSAFRSLEDTFGGVVGWTVEDSNSGFNMLRHHLLAYRKPDRPALYARSVGGLINPLGALTAVADRRVDVAPVDSFCHDLLRAAGHPVTTLTRTIATTAPTPIPALVASAAVPAETTDALSAALQEAHLDPEIAPALDDALIRRFAKLDPQRYEETQRLAEAAESVGYHRPG
jgi:ABC-type phosphate/phosphonate transport system substrate-binding protein